MNDFDGRITTLESAVRKFKKENEQLQLKVDDLDNRSRRCNIRITGLPEGAKANQPTSFIESCLGEIFGPDTFPRPLTVDRAHRLTFRRRQDSAPRPFVACFHHFQMKQWIMQLAREKGLLLYRGSEIHIYADYSTEVARKRATFSPERWDTSSAYASLPSFVWLLMDPGTSSTPRLKSLLFWRTDGPQISLLSKRIAIIER